VVKICNLDDDDQCCDGLIEIIDLNTGCPVQVYLPGPPGPAGSAGIVAVVDESGTIPNTQTYTVVDAGNTTTTQTLPLISTVLNGDEASTITVVNASTSIQHVIPQGEDEIIVRGVSVGEVNLFVGTSFTFLPTSIGWVLV